MAKGSEVVGFGEVDKSLLSFQELLDIGAIHIQEIDDRVQCDQSELVGVPFVLFHWESKPSETYGGNYAFCEVKTQSGTRVFADGGTGILPALERYKEVLIKQGNDPFSPIYFPRGLRVSSYVKKLGDQSIPAQTYYFDNAE